MSKKLEGKKLIVIPDSHYAPDDCPEGGVDEKAEACVLQAIEMIKPNIAVHIGDVGEWNGVSDWKYKRVKRPPLEYQIAGLEREAAAVNEGLDRIDAALDKAGCKERHLIEGNHEVWIDNFITTHPYLRNDFAPEKLLKLKERGWKYWPYGQYMKKGKLAFYHGGHYSGQYHAHKHATNLGHSVMYGHTHDQQTAKVATLGGYHGAWSIGCICKFDKAFLKGRPTNWSHNFAIVHFLPKGAFNVELVEIFDGVCHLWGQKITA